MRHQRKIVLFIGVILLLALGSLALNTGFLQSDEIDAKDLAHWNYENGVIVGAQGFTIEGPSGVCWVMVHGYTSTPDELRNVARAVNTMFNDTVYVPRLDGHGTVPSDVELYTVNFWYHQVDALAQTHNCTYLLGSSMGASLVLRYAEQHPAQGVVVMGIPLAIQPSSLPTGLLSELLAPIVHYTKRIEPGQTIDDVSARTSHITGYSFPLKGVGEVYEFDKLVTRDLAKVNASVLFLHATNDTVADVRGAREAFDALVSSKRFVELNGDHIIMRDYDKEKAIAEIERFRSLAESATDQT